MHEFFHQLKQEEREKIILYQLTGREEKALDMQELELSLELDRISLRNHYLD